MMLYGMSLIYGLFGSLDIAVLNKAYAGVLSRLASGPFAERAVIVLAVLFTLAGFA